MIQMCGKSGKRKGDGSKQRWKEDKEEQKEGKLE
jgi:hypothetical protein